jgi:hypothetical protein
MEPGLKAKGKEPAAEKAVVVAGKAVDRGAVQAKEDAIDRAKANAVAKAVVVGEIDKMAATLRSCLHLIQKLICLAPNRQYRIKGKLPLYPSFTCGKP